MRTKNYATGERNGRAKLSNREAAAIRRSKRRPTEIAATYGISLSQVYRIREGSSR